ncbi:MAG: hypothetical protein E7559_01300 [Ruminococcaceae bacterium]|nr:hypothetical protein [Oscillospiraceae bacterium]
MNRKFLKITAALLISALLLTLLLSAAGCAGKVTVEMQMQQYSGNNIIEIPLFRCTGSSGAADALNLRINRELWHYAEAYGNADGTEAWCEVTCYPITGERYVQVIAAAAEYPCSGTEGTVFSYNYDVENDAVVVLEDALAGIKTSVAAELNYLTESCAASGMKGLLRAEPCGFIAFDDRVWIIARLYFEEEQGKPYDKLYLYDTFSRTLLSFRQATSRTGNGALLALCDTMKPPLLYGREASASSDALTNAVDDHEAALYAAADAADRLFPGYGSLYMISEAVIDSAPCTVTEVTSNGQVVGRIAVSDDSARVWCDVGGVGCFYEVMEDGATVDYSVEYFVDGPEPPPPPEQTEPTEEAEEPREQPEEVQAQG